MVNHNEPICERRTQKVVGDAKFHNVITRSYVTAFPIQSFEHSSVQELVITNYGGLKCRPPHKCRRLQTEKVSLE